jgi:hypothetical protein
MQEFTSTSVSITHPTYITLSSSTNNLYVACESDGVMVSNRPVAAYWEKFNVLGELSNTFKLKTWKDTYISLDLFGMLTTSGLDEAAVFRCIDGKMQAVGHKRIKGGDVKIGVDLRLRVEEPVVDLNTGRHEARSSQCVVVSVLPPDRISLVTDSGNYVYATSNGLLKSNWKDDVQNHTFEIIQSSGDSFWLKSAFGKYVSADQFGRLSADDVYPSTEFQGSVKLVTLDGPVKIFKDGTPCIDESVKIKETVLASAVEKEEELVVMPEVANPASAQSLSDASSYGSFEVVNSNDDIAMEPVTLLDTEVEVAIEKTPAEEEPVKSATPPAETVKVNRTLRNNVALPGSQLLVAQSSIECRVVLVTHRRSVCMCRTGRKHTG